MWGRGKRGGRITLYHAKHPRPPPATFHMAFPSPTWLSGSGSGSCWPPSNAMWIVSEQGAQNTLSHLTHPTVQAAAAHASQGPLAPRAARRSPTPLLAPPPPPPFAAASAASSRRSTDSGIFDRGAAPGFLAAAVPVFTRLHSATWRPSSSFDSRQSHTGQKEVDCSRFLAHCRWWMGSDRTENWLWHSSHTTVGGGGIGDRANGQS